MRTLLLRLATCAVAVFFFFGAAVHDGAYGRERIDLSRMAEILPTDVYNVVIQIPEKPHFLRGKDGMEGYERHFGYDPETQWQAYLAMRRFWQTENTITTERNGGVIDKSEGTYALPEGYTAITDEVELNGAKTTIQYTNHHVEGGMYVFWSSEHGAMNMATFSPLYRKYEVQWSMGMLTDSQWTSVQEVLGWAEFESIARFVKAMLAEGLAYNLKFFDEFDTKVVARRAVVLDDPDYPTRLDDPVPGMGEGFTVADFPLVPRVDAENFLPDLILVSPNQFGGAWVTAWGVPSSERISLLSLGGLVWQYITGNNLVAHELVHANSYLQGTPTDFYFDVELYAALTADLVDGGTVQLFHPYFSVLRELVHAYLGFDYDEAARRIYPESPRGTVADIRKEEFIEVMKRTNEIREVLLPLAEELMIAHYTQPFFYLAVNRQFCDTAQALRLAFALRFEPAGIYDPERLDETGAPIPSEVQTKAWLKKEDEAGKLKALAKAAMEQTGTVSDEDKKQAEDSGIGDDTELGKLLGGFTQCPAHSRFWYMSDSERAEAKALAADLIERSKRGDMFASLLLRRIFAGAGGVGALNGL